MNRIIRIQDWTYQNRRPGELLLGYVWILKHGCLMMLLFVLRIFPVSQSIGFVDTELSLVHVKISCLSLLLAPICCEDLDIKDSSFLPCSVGFGFASFVTKGFLVFCHLYLFFLHVNCGILFWCLFWYAQWRKCPCI